MMKCAAASPCRNLAGTVLMSISSEHHWHLLRNGQHPGPLWPATAPSNRYGSMHVAMLDRNWPVPCGRLQPLVGSQATACMHLLQPFQACGLSSACACARAGTGTTRRCWRS
jgi:hypothetical protein